MIEVTGSQGWILAFDGRILEFFINKGSDRYHIKHVTDIKLKEKKKGFVEITGNTVQAIFVLPKIEPDQRTAAEQLVEQVNSAIG